MVYAFIAVLFVSLYGAKLADNNGFYSDYLGRDSTTSVNGIFVLLVFLSHLGTYIKFIAADQVWVQFKYFLGQLIVVTFLFYSGYGMMCSYMRKGRPYVKGIFKNRFLPLLLHFDIAVVLYAIVNLCIGSKFTFTNFLVALTTWRGIGNSNWYITAILSLYIVLIISFLVFKDKKIPSLILMSVLTVGLIFIFYFAGQPEYAFNTLPLFPLGMWYAYYKDKIDKLIMKSNTSYLITLFIAVIAFALGYRYWFFNIYLYGAAFMLIMLLITMKLKIGNSILNILGKHVFSIYILQRIPMRIFYAMGFQKKSIVFFALTFVSTLIIAFMFDKVMAKIDAVLFKPKKLKAPKAA